MKRGEYFGCGTLAWLWKQEDEKALKFCGLRENGMQAWGESGLKVARALGYSLDPQMYCVLFQGRPFALWILQTAGCP